MVNPDGETPAPSSGATAQAATSSNRPIVMPEAFSAAGNEEWDSWLSYFEGEIGEIRNVSENNLSKKVETKVVVNSFSSIHSVSSDTAVYVAGLVAGQPIDMLVDTKS